MFVRVQSKTRTENDDAVFWLTYQKYLLF